MADIVKGPLAETCFDREKALRSDLARVTAERDEARKEAKEIHDEWRRVAAHATTLSEQVHDMRMVIPERDALRAEVEAMRELLADNWPCRCGHPLCKRCKHDAEVAHALRARKVGG